MAPLTDRAQELADDERALLGHLLAVIEEHSVEGSRQIDTEATERAFAFACERHSDQRRRTGEDFIAHPGMTLAVGWRRNAVGPAPGRLRRARCGALGLL